VRCLCPSVCPSVLLSVHQTFIYSDENQYNDAQMLDKYVGTMTTDCDFRSLILYYSTSQLLWDKSASCCYKHYV